MTGEHNFIGKAMCLVMNGQKMMGGEIEKGLTNLKATAEKPGDLSPIKITPTLTRARRALRKPPMSS